MNTSSTLLKIATLTSSLLLAGTFISYRAGAFGWLTGSDRGATELPPTETKLRPTMSASSKVIVLEYGSAETPPKKEEPRTFLSGSKSLQIGSYQPGDRNTYVDLGVPPPSDGLPPAVFSGTAPVAPHSSPLISVWKPSNYTQRTFISSSKSFILTPGFPELERMYGPSPFSPPNVPPVNPPPNVPQQAVPQAPPNPFPMAPQQPMPNVRKGGGT